MTNGSGEGSYHAGDKVDITAYPAKTGMKFDRWIGDTKHIKDIHNPETTITMTHAIYTDIAAHYVKIRLDS